MTKTKGKRSLSISDAAKDKLDDLKEALEAVLGDDLVAIVAHGSAVRGGWRNGESDVDLIVVLREASREKLEAIAHPLMLARYSARIEAMLLVADEIPRAADVFPVFYDDVRREHLLLTGKDPFAELTINDHHLRLRVEQELREAQIRLRRTVTDGFRHKAGLAGAVVRKVRQIRAPLRSLLALKGIESHDDLEAVMTKAAELYKVDAAALLAVEKNPEKAYEALAKLLTSAVDDADRLGEASS